MGWGACEAALTLFVFLNRTSACAAFFATWHKTAGDFIGLAEWHNKSLCCFLEHATVHDTRLVQAQQSLQSGATKVCAAFFVVRRGTRPGNLNETAPSVIAVTRLA